MFGKILFFGYNNNMKIDVAIIGAGPAGLTAGIFSSRAGLKTVCFEKLAVGGQAALSYEIANYPGFESVSGFDLTQKMHKQAESCGTEFIYENVQKIKKIKSGFSIKTTEKRYLATKVIIACGCKARKLGLENELQLTGRGISYCASCDGGFFKNKIVAVVGGGNTAVEDVKYLARITKKVYLINRSQKFRAGTHAIEQLNKFKNLEIIKNAQVKKLFGDEKLEKISVLIDGKMRDLKVDGLFIAIGYEPDLKFLDIDVKLDKYGYILVDEKMRTNVDNLFACGDITGKSFKQVITACADGAIAGNSCIEN